MKKIIAMLFVWLIPAMASAVTDHNMNVSDTWPYYSAQAVNSTGTAIDLTGATVTAYMIRVVPATTTPKINWSTCQITSPADGFFEYRWTASDTNTAGQYYIYFRVTDGTTVFTIPQRERAKVIISAP